MRKAGHPALLALAVVSVLPVMASSRALAQDDAGAPRTTMTCERVAEPGRVRCEVEARVEPGESISWGDVVLLHLPPFVAALRGRIGPHDAAVREPGLWRWNFAIVARGKGTGDVEGQVRVVVCREKACAAREVPVVGKVEVGP